MYLHYLHQFYSGKPTFLDFQFIAIGAETCLKGLIIKEKETAPVSITHTSDNGVWVGVLLEERLCPKVKYAF